MDLGLFEVSRAQKVGVQWWHPSPERVGCPCPLGELWVSASGLVPTR